MAKILIAWEYGSGFGHVALIVPLALRLKQAGHTPILALRDAHSTQHLWKDKGLTVIQAPYIRMPATWDKTIITETLADIFILAGLSNADNLIALSKAWQDLLAKVQPDMVICEFSPTLALVTLGVIPTITIGISFAVPPTGRRLPTIRFWKKELSPVSITNEDIMTDVIHKARKALNLPPLEFFSDMFGGDAVFVCALPELDGYGEYRTTPAIGPLTELGNAMSAMNLKMENRKKAFVYLSHDEEELPSILRALQQSSLSCDAYIRGFKSDKIAEFTSGNLLLHDAPQVLTEILPERGLLIHHGGMSTSDLGLRIGIPQMIISRHLEQRVNASLLMQLGVAGATMAKQCNEPNLLISILENITTNDHFIHNARKRAEDIHARGGRPALDIVVEACDKIAGRT